MPRFELVQILNCSQRENEETLSPGYSPIFVLIHIWIWIYLAAHIPVKGPPATGLAWCSDRSPSSGLTRWSPVRPYGGSDGRTGCSSCSCGQWWHEKLLGRATSTAWPLIGAARGHVARDWAVIGQAGVTV